MHQVVSVPFNHFSYDWSDYTGACTTKDPTGVQHYCCDQKPEVCPQAANLAEITNIAVWGEGAQGDLHLEIAWIAAAV
jgi:hypothetical protein